MLFTVYIYIVLRELGTLLSLAGRADLEPSTVFRDARARVRASFNFGMNKEGGSWGENEFLTGVTRLGDLLDGLLGRIGHSEFH